MASLMDTANHMMWCNDLLRDRDVEKCACLSVLKKNGKDPVTHPFEVL